MSPAPVRVAHLTDTHLLAEPDQRFCGIDSFGALKGLLEEIQRDSWKPDLLLITGDLSDDGSAASYRRLRELLIPLGLPVYCLPGNHDDRAVMHASLEGGSIQLARVVAHDSWQIVLLDSQVPGKTHGNLSNDELDDLERALLQAPGLFTLVGLHHGPYPVCPVPGCRLENSEALLRMLSGCKNTRAVVAGHTHCEINEPLAGIQMLVTPSTCINVTHPSGPDAPLAGSFWELHGVQEGRRGYRRLELHADGTIVTSVVWQGEEADAEVHR
ncbi:MAG: metallophosphoesterase [Acidobacteriota bacterium]